MVPVGNDSIAVHWLLPLSAIRCYRLLFSSIGNGRDVDATPDHYKSNIHNGSIVYLYLQSMPVFAVTVVLLIGFICVRGQVHPLTSFGGCPSWSATKG